MNDPCAYKRKKNIGYNLKKKNTLFLREIVI